MPRVALIEFWEENTRKAKSLCEEQNHRRFLLLLGSFLATSRASSRSPSSAWDSTRSPGWFINRNRLLTLPRRRLIVFRESHHRKRHRTIRTSRLRTCLPARELQAIDRSPHPSHQSQSLFFLISFDLHLEPYPSPFLKSQTLISNSSFSIRVDLI